MSIEHVLGAFLLVGLAAALMGWCRPWLPGWLFQHLISSSPFVILGGVVLLPLGFFSASLAYHGLLVLACGLLLAGLFMRFVGYYDGPAPGIRGGVAFWSVFLVTGGLATALMVGLSWVGLLSVEDPSAAVKLGTGAIAAGTLFLLGADIVELPVSPFSQDVGWLVPVSLVCRSAGGHLHCADGPAVVLPNGRGYYFWNGVHVPRRAIVAPEKLTAGEVLEQRNIESRRVMIERMGYERFIQTSGLRPVHEDKTGALYRQEFQDGEPLVVVYVADATEAPDGTRRRYLLRVPPAMRTAREAVAWTFGMTESAYWPTKET